MGDRGVKRRREDDDDECDDSDEEREMKSKCRKAMRHVLRTYLGDK